MFRSTTIRIYLGFDTRSNLLCSTRKTELRSLLYRDAGRGSTANTENCSGQRIFRGQKLREGRETAVVVVVVAVSTRGRYVAAAAVAAMMRRQNFNPFPPRASIRNMSYSAFAYYRKSFPPHPPPPVDPVSPIRVYHAPSTALPP